MTEASFLKKFPTKRARDAADEAIDAVAVTEPMTIFVDAWISAYVAAGGIVVGGPLA